jgi:hypothetical protein
VLELISNFKVKVILVLLFLGLTYVGLKFNNSGSPTEVRIPSSSQLHITKIPKDQLPFPPEQDQKQNIQEKETTSTAEPILSEEDINLINLLPEEAKELATKDESYRDSLKQQYLNQEAESTPPTQEDLENPYEKLQNDPEHLKKFDPNILPEGEDNPYRKLLENRN